MAENFPFQNKSLHLALIVMGVFGVFGLIKALTPSEELRLSVLEGVQAGMDTSVAVQGEAKEVVHFSLEMPSGLAEEYTLALDGEGESSLDLPGSSLQKAGDYTLSASYGKRADVSQSFTVSAGEPDLTHSRLSFSTPVLEAGQSALLSVSLADAYDNPVVGHTLSVVPDSSAVQVFTSEFVTNEQGQMNFTVLGDGDGLAQLTLFDATLGKNILAPSQIALTGGETLEDSVMLAESGPVDSFVINGLDSTSAAGDNLTVIIKAIDEEGFTVTDYTGTIRFSSSDDQASLPNDYTFLADDQGEHTFSLGVKFVTPGDQMLVVTDLDDVKINGDAETNVSTDENSSTDYDSDFETDDFAREGDFELISPASGSYSSSTVEIQGEAEYGNTAFIMVNKEEAAEADIEFDNSFSYTLQDLEDGEYEIYVEIRDEDDQVIETSSTESVTIDTTPASLVSISVDPSGSAPAGSEVTVTVLSEADLDEASVLFEEDVYTMEETNTSGKYQVTLVAPDAEGDYSMDVLLVDSLGNEVQYRDQATLKVSASDTEPTVDETPVEDTQSSVAKVTNLTAKGGAELVALSWEAPDSALSIAYYRVYYGPSPASLFAVSETTDSSTNWTISELIGDELYYFAVTAVDVEGTESEISETVLGVPEADNSAPVPVPDYPVSTNLDANVQATPETGPASTGLLLLSSLGAMSYVLLRRRARA